MTILLYANNAQATLASGINNTATTCVLAAGTGALFPSPGAGQAFYVTFANAPTPSSYEIALCTGRSGDTLTIVRGQDGTSAATWATGDFVEMLPTRGTMNNLIQIDQYQNGVYYKAGSVAGTGNAITATLTSNFTALFDGLSILLTAGAANTGAATLNLTLGITATGATAIVKGNNSALIAGDIPSSGYPIKLTYSSTYSAWVMQNPAVTNNATSISGVQYVAAGGTANAITATYSPAVAAVSDGLKLRFKASAANTGAVTFSPNGLTAAAVLNQFRLPITAGLIQTSSECEVTYDSGVSSWILTAPVSTVLSAGLFNTSGDTNISTVSGAWREQTVHLQGLTAGTDYQLWCRINADTGANYEWQILNSNGASGAGGFGNSTASGISLTESSSLVDSTNMNLFGLEVDLVIKNPSNTSFEKTIHISQNNSRANSSSRLGLQNGTGGWRNTAAITSITILLRGTASATAPTGAAINATGGTWYITGTT